ncbi:hypothetical protein M8J77_001785 [Diaphorina citri]|nr:hypothetical protein M8J77_001785 [Diaphorina citri]KAI5750851.1 hypothetical protein M8J77_001785 [Diaphorina citri]KAI5750852.1 hypothetical protein M8J77_001785 [Diaphorina citri]KAI5750853.1 hypothetical protein M8J77_001785 [Diaphorina citri]
MSVSVPNLTSTTNTSNLENVNPSLLETFTAIAKRAQGLQISNNSTNIARTNNNCNQSNIAASTVTNNSIFPRAPASVSSLVRLALSSNFPAEYFRRMRLVLRTELNGKNKMEAINSLAVPVIDYSFGIIEWTQEELRKLDTKTRKCLTLFKMLHPRADVSRLYLPRRIGGRGLRNIKDAHDIAILRMGKYINCASENDKVLTIIQQCLNESNTQKNIVNRAERLERNLGIENTHSYSNIKAYKNKIKQTYMKKNENEWKNEPLHGQFKRQVEEDQSLDEKKTFDWMKTGKIKGVSEAYITSAQDQALRTKYYDKHILKLNNDDKCRLCKTQPETITHVISGCQQLAKHEYTNRHNRVCIYVHYQICKHFKFPVSEKWYQHNPDPVMSNDDVVVLYDQSIQTDRTILSNRPDIVIKEKKKKECLLIDISIPADSNVNKKENEKKLKYTDLAIEIQRMWNMKSCKVVPVVIGALGAISKALKPDLDSIPGSFNIHEIQTCALLGTTYILRRFGI